MDQEITAAMAPQREFFNQPSRDGAPGEEGLFPGRGARRWLPPAERMPPIVQFALHVVQWCRSRGNAGRKNDAPLRLVGQLALGAKRHLALVEVGGAQFLVGGGAEHVTVIVPVPRAAETDGSPLPDPSGIDSPVQETFS